MDTVYNKAIYQTKSASVISEKCRPGTGSRIRRWTFQMVILIIKKQLLVDIKSEKICIILLQYTVS